MPGRKYTLEERLEVVMHYLASDEGYRLPGPSFLRLYYYKEIYAH